MTKLHLAENLKLPVDAATQTFAFIGRKGSGKTYGAGKLTELLIAAGVQTIVLDLVGKWWGLRLAADGKRPGIDIPVLGGLRGDIPLESAGGALIAEALLESGRSAILDLSQFSKSGRQEFAYRFGLRLWQLQKAQLNPVPVHLVIEESQLIVPENIPAGGKGEFLREMYGVFEEIIRLGRNYGIGITLITQRPQSVAKEVLNQAEPLLVFQVTGSHERKAIKQWIQHQGMDEALTDTLPAQTKGQCWFWSPEWLGELKQVQIAAKWTFDSTATPKVGASAPKARAIKPLDLSDLQTKMATTIERAKADDPKRLKARIAELEKAAKLGTTKGAKDTKGPPDEAVVQRAVTAALRLASAEWLAEKKKMHRSLGQACKILRQIGGLAGGTDFSQWEGECTAPVLPPSLPSLPSVQAPRPAPPRKMPARDVSFAANGDTTLSKAERAILAAFYWLKDETATPAKVAFYSDYSAGSSTSNNALGKLRHGFVSGWKITPEGAAAAEALGVGAKPAGAELLAWCKGKLGRAECAMLDALVAAHPQRLTSAELGERSGYSVGSSTFNNAIGKLRTIEAAEGYERDGGTKAADVFLEG